MIKIKFKTGKKIKLNYEEWKELLEIMNKPIIKIYGEKEYVPLKDLKLKRQYSSEYFTTIYSIKEPPSTCDGRIVKFFEDSSGVGGYFI